MESLNNSGLCYIAIVSEVMKNKRLRLKRKSLLLTFLIHLPDILCSCVLNKNFAFKTDPN